MSTKVVPAPADQAKRPVRSEKPANHTDKQLPVHEDDARLAHNDSEDKVSVAKADEGREHAAAPETSMAADFSFGGALAEAAASSGSLITEAAQADEVSFGQFGDGDGSTVLLIGAVALVGLGIVVLAGGGHKNHAPTVDSASQALAVTEDTAKTFTVTATDTDNDVLTYTATGATKGVVTGGTNGAFTYTPNANANGTDTITVTVKDPDGLSATQTVNVTIAAVADAPVAGAAQAITTAEDTAKSGTASITDADGDAITYSIASAAAHGTVVLTTAGAYSYTPAANYIGADTFSIKGTTADGSATQVVNVTVTPVADAPVAAATQAITTAEDTNATGTVGITDVDGDTIAYTVDTAAGHGTVTVADNGTYTYVPAANYNGTDSFTIKGTTGDGSASQTFNVTVTAVNDAPVAAAAQAITTAEDTAKTGTAQISDVEGDAITYSVGVAAAHGTVTLGANGAYTYTPAANFNGTDSFGIKGTTPDAASATQTVNVTVTAVNDAPNLGPDQTFSVVSGTSLTGTVVATDPDTGDTLTYGVTTQPTHGTLTLSAAGALNYTPTAGYVGSDSFVINVKDAANATDTETVTVNVTSAAVVADNLTGTLALAGTSGADQFTDNVTVRTDVTITGFSASGGDRIVVDHPTDNAFNAKTAYSYTATNIAGGATDDLVITYNSGGNFTQIVLVDAAINADGGTNFVFDYASAVQSLGADFITIA